MKVYIAGPMSGIPEYNFPAFHEAEARLTELGYEVVSPAQHGTGTGDTSKGQLVEEEWVDFMRKDIKLLLDCEAAVFLSGWQLSRGATLEYTIAEKLGFKMGVFADNDVVWIR